MRIHRETLVSVCSYLDSDFIGEDEGNNPRSPGPDDFLVSAGTWITRIAPIQHKVVHKSLVSRLNHVLSSHNVKVFANIFRGEPFLEAYISSFGPRGYGIIIAFHIKIFHGGIIFHFLECHRLMM